MSQSSAQTGCKTCSVNHDTPSYSTDEVNFLTKHWQPIVSALLLTIGLILDYFIDPVWFNESFRLAWYLIAYLPVGYPVVKMGWESLIRGEVFTEFFLMSIATFGAFFIGEYPEGVAVMLFYSVGEAFQHSAVQKARSSIRALLDVRAEVAHVKDGNSFKTVHPDSVPIGQIIQVKPGERVPLDGKLITDRAAFDTSAITGESKPRHISDNENVLAGMINLNRVIELEVQKTYENSSISRILKMVQEATSRKAKTELFIRSFAKVYTPIVVLLATLLVALPALFVSSYVFEEWLYRGLVFLVISCPCALVISIPLGYFGGIGAASKNGILVKGGNFLDALRSVKTVVFDKTGTLTHATFSVQNIELYSDMNESQIGSYLFAVEKVSNHPIARAITDYIYTPEHSLKVDQQNEIPGYGLKSIIEGQTVVIGNQKLMENEQVELNKSGSESKNSSTKVHMAIDGIHQATVTISDRLKDDAKHAIRQLHHLGVDRTVMLSGDHKEVVEEVGRDLKIDEIYGDLLPEQKSEKLEEIKERTKGKVAYAGDGINDAPVLALSDVGIAMGAMGSDAAVETADVVIQSDQLTKIAESIRIARKTRNIVWQNIGLALGVKTVVLALGALGMASLWEAVFADVGVALLAILNAVRIQKMNFSSNS
ncbi:heavy metal translocating P-type ATPase [Rhodohalobacter barkolensis]|uniref:P-type Zn(2+) transporter n=1 Tax=Rhodohalobacter barkolensis TaxID=2053187 RepID=A0A2N0VJT7_9BACT|nr:heavy metal translocating P-type ATPase [Rhodohalobacter barkolensis]PKD44439.1 cadmium-translocating P-type ATPase [Rhodohalobacter barkolensis]